MRHLFHFCACIYISSSLPPLTHTSTSCISLRATFARIYHRLPPTSHFLYSNSVEGDTLCGASRGCRGIICHRNERQPSSRIDLFSHLYVIIIWIHARLRRRQRGGLYFCARTRRCARARAACDAATGVAACAHNGYYHACFLRRGVAAACGRKEDTGRFTLPGVPARVLPPALSEQHGARSARTSSRRAFCAPHAIARACFCCTVHCAIAEVPLSSLSSPRRLATAFHGL